MATAQAKQQVNSLFDLLGIPRPNATRLDELAGAIDAGSRSPASIRDDLVWYLANSQGVSFKQALVGVVQGWFEQTGVNVATQAETAGQRLNRIAEQMMNGTRTYHEVFDTIQSYASPAPSGGGGGGDANWWEKYRNPEDPTYGANPNQPQPNDPGKQPNPSPTPEPQPTPTTVDYMAQARVLYPWMPTELLQLFADKWDETGSPDLALAFVRADSRYDTYFPGIKRPDGSLRMTESQWFAQREAYGSLLTEFGLNPDLFSNKFTQLMEGNVSAQEFASRLGSVYEGIVTNIPQTKAWYAQHYGLELSDAAIFASAIDPEMSQAILNRKISVAQIGGEGLARHFDVSSNFAEQLASGGLTQADARQFFSSAEQQVPSLDTLAKRYRDRDPTFDLQEYAQASVFGDAGQSRRIDRLLAAESSAFTDSAGTFALNQDLAVIGLRAR